MKLRVSPPLAYIKAATPDEEKIKAPPGRPPVLSDAKNMPVNLDVISLGIAFELGGGNRSAGIRRALHKAAMMTIPETPQAISTLGSQLCPVVLEPDDVRIALTLGHGNRSLGVREALRMVYEAENKE